jgi:putative acetyltransferase
MNIIIRSAEPTDAEGIWKCFTSPQVVRNTLQLPFRNLESIRQQLTNPTEGNYQLVAEVDGEIVGSLGLHTTTRPRIKHKADFGMNVRDDWQGKGVGSALMAAMIDLADNWLNLTRLELTVYTDNEAAIAMYKKFGFEIEGTLRKFAFRDGEFVDAYTMARVR